MAEPTNEDSNSTEPAMEEPIPVMQSIMDNPFLILFMGVVIPTVFYTLWGIMEIVAIPVAG